MMNVYVTVNLKTQAVRAWDDIGQATEHATRENRADSDHPSFHLWFGRVGEEMEFVGRLHRDFGKVDLYWKVER